MRDLADFNKQLVLVAGDMMVDKYILGTVERISPEAPVPVLRQNGVKRRLGGTGNVIANLISLGAGVRALGRVGDDMEGAFFRENLHYLHVDDRYIFTSGSTIVKTRVSSSNQQFLRIDEESVAPLSENVTEQIASEIEMILQDITIVIISDYAKGFITEELAQIIIQAARTRAIPVLVDPKGAFAAKYKGATAITPNNKEFLDLTGLTTIPSEDEIKVSALHLCNENSFDYFIFTRSEKGISVIERESGEKSDYPAVVKEVVDVTGAGDTVVSSIALTMGAEFSMDECVSIANIAASIVISRFGASQTTIEELNNAISFQSKKSHDVDSVLAQINWLKHQGKRIVFTNGCFDLVHAGHISSFLQAREFGDVLVVGVNSDESIRRIKGNSRPIVDLEHRIELLSALECVDYVVPFCEDTPQALIEQIKPDVLVKGMDWMGKEVAGSEFVRSYGGRVVFIELEQGLSTTNIVQKIRRSMD
ncbi:MAG: D-glycero-beta-D-manno-heptose 1-phosphate adenylyltransferase [Oscillospiraceae bacterium]|nr:D-glycero-beta-D-manno-heptose 1-phosphate adenylyltransferase [Oscillospiraceae bacterium]